MKNKIFFVVLLVLCLLLFNENAKAACASGVTVGDESLCLTTGCVGCTFES